MLLLFSPSRNTSKLLDLYSILIASADYSASGALSQMRSFCGGKGKNGFYFEVNKSEHYFRDKHCQERQLNTPVVVNNSGHKERAGPWHVACLTVYDPN